MKLMVVSAVLCGLAAAAHADRADQLFKKGKKLLAEKRYAEACTAFEDSDRLDPGIGAKLNVAKCYQDWGKLATAWRWYSDAERQADAAKDDRATKIHALAAEVDAVVPRLIVRLPPGARLAGVVVRLDGVELAPGAFGSELRVDPGPHQVETIVDGERQTKLIPVERGGSSEVTLELPTASSPGEPRRFDDPVAPRDPMRSRRLIGLGVAGAGGLTVGIAGIVVLRAHSDYSHAITGHCNGAPDMCDIVGLSRTHSARHRANIATVMTLGGLAAVGGGLYLYLTAPAAGRRDEHAVYIVPALGVDAGGLVVGGAF